MPPAYGLPAEVQVTFPAMIGPQAWAAASSSATTYQTTRLEPTAIVSLCLLDKQRRARIVWPSYLCSLSDLVRTGIRPLDNRARNCWLCRGHARSWIEKSIGDSPNSATSN